jgi:hypothetical protein
VVTPWFIDIIGEPFARVAARINLLLKPGGRWVNYGSLAFSRAAHAERVSLEANIAAALAAPARPAADRPRDATSKPAEVLSFLGLERGMRVLDMNAATGWYTEILARVVGLTGHVIALVSSNYGRAVPICGAATFCNPNRSRTQWPAATPFVTSLPRFASRAPTRLISSA